ncbi:hypothetical protein [Phenylobacterium sp.]|uniref:hypothetical protein n=1 Tax=Phenylobacterium sp. TaxID=1871053 RepID=UPI002E35E24A|nr:hypothetical protein [Phenylobacterium sp.]HEX3363687.1 hypothetical protein [Phenylobacterium sp.]
MKGNMRAAAALGVGYMLGRNRKFRTAAMMAAGMTVGGTNIGNIALKRGMKMLGSTDAIQKVAPQLTDLADTVRGDLIEAGKAAAMSAVTSRVDALTDSLHERAERVRNPAATVAEGTEAAAEAGQTATRTGRRAATGTARRAGDAAGGATRRVTGRGRAADAEPDEAEADDDYEPDEYEEDDYEEDDQADEADEADEAEEAEEAEEPEEPEEPPARRTPTRRRAPVSRAKR